MAITFVSRRLCGVVKNKAPNKPLRWFSPLMAAASRAIVERIPQVDFTLEVRDARIPISSGYEYTGYFPSSSQRIIVLNKTDLANRSQTGEWVRHFEKQDYICYGLNSHNKENIKEFLNFLQARVRDLMAVNRSKFTTTLMLVGIPNAGKSAIANSLHQIGRISATEKGKLKNATVSPLPGETKDICSFKIGSHPNIYVLDTPGVLSPDIPDYEMALKLALTGAFDDCLFGEENLARHFLAIVSLSDVYKKWETMASEDIKSTMEYKRKPSDRSEVYKKRRKIGYTDHTQDYIVRDVRRTLFETISSFKGNLEDDNEKARLIEDQLLALREAFRVPLESVRRAQRPACFGIQAAQKSPQF